jgi:hypothetical protein
LTFSFPWIRPLIPLFVVPVPATHMRPFCSRLGPFAYLIFMPLDPAPTPPSIEHHSTSMTAYTTWDIVEYIFEYHVTHRWHRPCGPPPRRLWSSCSRFLRSYSFQYGLGKG